MPERASIPLELKFRGERRYLHGTDLFNALTRIARCERDLRLRIYRTMECPVRATPLGAGEAPPAKPSALFESGRGDERRAWAVTEDPAAPAPGRYPVDEEAIVAAASLVGETVEQVRAPGFSFIERAVALNKRLLGAVVEGGPTDWWFTRIDLDEIPADDAPLRLTLRSRLGSRVFVSQIAARGASAGTIHFSRR